MKKSFCDFCGIEMTDKNDLWKIGEITVSQDTTKPEMVFHIGGVRLHVDADACKYCVIDAINKHDDRASEEN